MMRSERKSSSLAVSHSGCSARRPPGACSIRPKAPASSLRRGIRGPAASSALIAGETLPPAGARAFGDAALYVAFPMADGSVGGRGTSRLVMSQVVC